MEFNDICPCKWADFCQYRNVSLLFHGWRSTFLWVHIFRKELYSRNEIKIGKYPLLCVPALCIQYVFLENIVVCGADMPIAFMLTPPLQKTVPFHSLAEFQNKVEKPGANLIQKVGSSKLLYNDREHQACKVGILGHPLDSFLSRNNHYHQMALVTNFMYQVNKNSFKLLLYGYFPTNDALF